MSELGSIKKHMVSITEDIDLKFVIVAPHAKGSFSRTHVILSDGKNNRALLVIDNNSMLPREYSANLNHPYLNKQWLESVCRKFDKEF